MKLPPPKTRAAIYARKATTSAATAIDDQITSCRNFIEDQSWTEGGVYADAAGSGSSIATRDGFFTLMAAAGRGDFSVVLVSDIDRLSRSPSAVLQIVRDLDDLGVAVCTVQSGLVDAMGVQFKAAMDSSNAGSLSGRGRRKSSATVRREITGPDEAVVRRIYSLFARGLDVGEVCRRLNQEGAPDRPTASQEGGE